jgi:hypothetical protein
MVKLLLGGKVYTIKRGQSSLSMRSWAYEFKMSVKAVDTFFDLLVAESMIKREVIGKGKHSTTLVTIENYDSYQHVSEITFEPIKQQLKRDLVKYESKIVGQSNAGKLGNLRRWNKDLYDKVISRKVTLDEALNIAKHRKTSQPDSTQGTPQGKSLNIQYNNVMIMIIM